jgi:hypothetical protein
MKRAPIGKRLRFAVFARDGFTCRYCGRQSDTVALHIDHILPVVEGGTNDESNLITACADCNLGKGAKVPEFQQPTEADRLRASQEMHEQREAAERARAAVQYAKEMEQELVNLWCSMFSQTSVPEFVVQALVSLTREHGFDCLLDWMYICSARLGSSSDHKRIKYIYGIRRNQTRTEAT